MNAPRLFRIANRINLLLLRELGQGIDCKRLLAEPRYARDVLLVCDAMPGSDLASLAQHFRATQAQPFIDGRGAASGFGIDSSGFGVSRPHGVPLDIELPHAAVLAAPRWYSPSRWLGGR